MEYGKGQQGFLLVESVLAGVIITVSLLGVLGLFVQGLQAAAAADTYTSAAGLAQEQMEKMKVKDAMFWQTVSFPYQSVEASIVLNKVVYTRTTQAEVSMLDPEYPAKQRILKVTVQVEWPGDRKINLVTYVLRDVPQFAEQ